MPINIKGETDNNMIENFNTPFLTMERASRQKINKDTLDFNYILDQMDLTEIDKTSHPTAAEYIFFKRTWNILQDIHCMLDHKTSLSN